MSISRDVNLGTLIPIALFLILQTGGGIWWASSVHTTVSDISYNQQNNLIALNEENLRQWGRINSIELRTSELLADQRTTSAIVQRIEADVAAVRVEIQGTNSLLREYIIQSANKGNLDD